MNLVKMTNDLERMTKDPDINDEDKELLTQVIGVLGRVSLIKDLITQLYFLDKP